MLVYACSAQQVTIMKLNGQKPGAGRTNVHRVRKRDHRFFVRCQQNRHMVVQFRSGLVDDHVFVCYHWLSDRRTKAGHKSKKHKNSKDDRWRIKTPNGHYYFNQQAIRSSHVRRQMKQRPLEELHKRNNVEASIFQLSFPLRNNKSKYRGLLKQKAWAYCRCLWINLVRILNFTKQICQRTFKTMEIPALELLSSGYLNLQIRVQPIFCRKFSMALFLSIIINLFVLK